MSVNSGDMINIWIHIKMYMTYIYDEIYANFQKTACYQGRRHEIDACAKMVNPCFLVTEKWTHN